MAKLVWTTQVKRPVFLWFTLWAILGISAFLILILFSTILHDVIDAAEFIGTPTIIMAIFWAPILEELVFRSWVTNWLPGL